MAETLVLSFGEATAESGLFFVSEIDAAMMADADGNVPSLIAPGVTAYLLAHHGDDLAIVRAYESAGGAIARVGEVTRTASIEVHFAEPGEEIELPHIPVSKSVQWYGKTGSLTLAGRKLTCSAAHVTGLVSYSYRAIQYRYRPPAMDLEDDETFPVDIDFEVRAL